MTDNVREVWLNKMAAKMAPRFEKLGFPLPPFRVSIGWTSGGKRARAGAEVWGSSASGDNHFEIFISPITEDPMQVSAYLAHELSHTAAGIDQGHSGDFACLMRHLGMKRPMTGSNRTPAFDEWVQPFIDELGPIPHAKLSFGMGEVVRGAKRKAKQVDAGEATVTFDMTSAPAKQTTRLLKVACSECGYTARVTQKWLDVGAPHCPEHGAMKVEAEEAKALFAP